MKLNSSLLLLLPTSTIGFSVVVVPNHSRPSTSTTQLFGLPVGVFFGTSTGSTESAAELIAAEFGAPEPIDIDLVGAGNLAAEFQKYDALIVGTPTWNTGADTERSGTGWDEVYYTDEMQTMSTLGGKKVAVFGMGDSISYAENYADATGELHDVFQSRGCNMMGFTSQEGYEHEASKAILEESGLFCGLLLDNVNFEELTEGRVQAWVGQLKEEGILESSSGAAAAPEPVAVAAPAAVDAPVAATDADAAMRAIIAQLEEENAALKQQLDTSTTSMTGSDGYQPHFNAKTGRTMWTSPDGRTCYYTETTSMSP